MEQQRLWIFRNPLALLRLATILVGIGFVIFAIMRAIPPSTVVFEVGPRGGSYEQTAMVYREALKQRGVNLELQYNPDSQGIVDHVNVKQGGAMLGFTAQQVAPGRAPNIASLGAIELQPLFIFYAQQLGELNTPKQLIGRRIALPPERSATSQAALRVLAYYGVDQGNTQFLFMPLLDAVNGLIAQSYDVGIFMLASGNPNIARLMRDPNLALLNMSDADALSRREPDLSTTTLPKHIYDFVANKPPEDVALLGANINVVVNKSLHPGIVYALLGVMAEAHRAPTFVSNTGNFPNSINTLLPLSSNAETYYKSGTSWFYREFPMTFAALIDYYLLIAILIFLISECYTSFAELGHMMSRFSDMAAFQVVLRLERKSRDGGTLRPAQMTLLRLAEHLLTRTSHRQRGAEIMTRIRGRQEDRHNRP